jgi:CRISPR-associated endonuclease/helicase Cas3
MYFKDVELFDISKYVSNLDGIYAHTKENHKEKLKEHMDLVYEYFLKMCKKKNLDNIFKNLEKLFLKDSGNEAVKLWKELLCNAVYMHDMGKINSHFQYKKMDNERYAHKPQIDSKHSMLSACIYFDYYFNKIKCIKGEVVKSLLTFLFLNSYIISKHHGSLDDFSVFYKTLEEKYRFYLDNKILYEDYKEIFTLSVEKIKGFWDVCKNMLESYDAGDSWNSIDIFAYSRLLFSLMVACDFYATSDYQSGSKVESFGTLDDIDRFYGIFKDGAIYKSIQKHKTFLEGKGESPFKEGDINRLRSEMFLEAESNLEKNMKENIFYLEAPTGAGKTNASVNLAFKLLEYNKNVNKIFYIFPFNTLVEQTKKSLDNIFEDNDDIKKEIAIVNSITPIQIVDVDEDSRGVVEKGTGRKINYEKALLDRQFLHYPIVLTTHVSFFTHLFGVTREEVFTLAQIANSVVILDEIQSYKNDIWKEIIIFLNKYAQFLNIKVIIMSATLPRLEQLVNSEQSFVQLIENRNKYFESPLFKERVELDFSILDIKEDVKGSLMKLVISSAKELEGNILIEFIKKKSALEFYKELLEFNEEENINKKVLLITGDDNKAERNRIIKLVKSEKNIILVATQVIEAGVDIDMDRGFKDISILDAEEQFLGRINRSCKKKGSKVYFFNMDDASVVYKKDYRKDKTITLLEENIRKLLQVKDFQSFYSIIMDRIEKDLNRENLKNIEDFRKEVIQKLKYTDIQERMRLIEEKKEYTVFLNRDIELENGSLLIGSKVWQDYCSLLTDSKMDYAEKKVKLSVVQEQMDYFTYNIDGLDVSYNGVIGNIFYIDDGEKYFIEGKFDRKLLKEGRSFEIL